MDYVAMYPETFDAVRRYSPEDRCYLYEAIGAYAFTGEEPSWPDEDIKWFVWESLRQRIEACKRISEARKASGSKGGRARQPEARESKPKQNEANASKPNPDTDTDTDTDTEEKKIKKERRFQKPTVEQVAEYVREHSYPVDAQAFVDFYESKGWKVGNQAMRDWQAAVRTWARNDRQRSQPRQKTVVAQQYEQRDYSQQEPEPIPDWMTERWKEMQGGK